MLNFLVRPPDFALARRYTDALRTLGLMVFFSPILPASPFIAFAGLLFSYATDKYVALRVARLPNELSARATATLNTVVKLLPLGQILQTISGEVQRTVSSSAKEAIVTCVPKRQRYAEPPKRLAP